MCRDCVVHRLFPTLWQDEGMDRKKLLRLIAAIVSLVAIFLLLSFILTPLLSSDAVQRAIESLGPWGPLVLITYTIVAHIIAPLAGSVGFLVGATAFGVPTTVLYIYTGSMISAIINFSISRRFGRPLVVRFVGQKTMQKIDGIVNIAGLGTLAILRLFGVAIFEETSYAAGLTNMRFRTYMTITVLASIPPHLAIAFLFANTNFALGANLALLLLILSALGAASTVLVHLLLKKRRRASTSTDLQELPD
jgi:uncharacterized membrane protein YdjX (TVP38/TMEM64 family)